MLTPFNGINKKLIMKIYNCCMGEKINKTRKEKTNKFRKVILIFLSFLLFLSCSIYIFQINKIATLGYEIKNKEDELDLLNEENKRLTIETAEDKSILSFELAKLDDLRENDEDEENKKNEEGAEEDEEKREENECFLTKMKKPEKVSYIEINVEKAFAMK